MAPQQSARHLFMPGVGIGMEEADSDRLHALRLEPTSQLRNRIGLERGDYLAFVVRSLGNLEAQVAGNEGWLFAKTQVVDVRPVGAADLEHVAKTLTCDDRGASAGSLHQRVDHDGRAVDKLLDRFGSHTRFLEG